MVYSIKKLDQAGLDKVKALESKLGGCILAVEGAPKPATISNVQLTELQATEKEMGAVLIAYQCK